MHRNRSIFSALLAMLGVILLLPSCMAAAGRDNAARLDQLQKQMENALNQGQGIPPELVEEMQKLLEEMQKGEADATPDQEPGFVPVPFSGTVTLSLNSRGNWSTKGASIATSSVAKATAIIQGTREERNDQGEIEDHIPQGMVLTQISGNWRMEGGDEEGKITATRSYAGSDRRQFGSGISKEISLWLDPQRKVYKIDLPNGWAEAKVREVITGPHLHETREYTQSINVSAVAEKGGMDAADEYPYTPGAGGLYHSYSVPTWAIIMGEEPAFGAGMRADDPMLAEVRKEYGENYLLPITLTVTWSLYLKDGDVEAVIEPVGDYDNWLPAAGISGAGGLVKAKVRIVKPEGAKGHITFRLLDVSQVKGECMNSPPRDPDTHLDLQFSKTGSSKGIWVGPDGTEARTEDPLNEATIAVQSRDFGAWGRLEAEVKVVVKGREQAARAVYKALGTDWLALPRDDDGDHVADGWAKQMGIDENAIEDNDPRPGKTYPGDGLSVYEEYRGFMVKGRHVRTDPTVKDLFIWDPDSLIPQSNVSGGALGTIKVHLVAADEIKSAAQGPQGRMINFNFDPPTHAVDQHGLLIFKGDLANIGHTFESFTNPDARLGPPVESDRIEVNPNYTFNQICAVVNKYRQEYTREKGPDWPDAAWYEARLAETIAFAVAHEVSHGVGVRHHTPESAPPYSCLMSQPEMDGYNGFCSYNLFKGMYMWGIVLCDKCREQIMVSDIYEGQGYLPPP
ncbi:MAG: hypothetical protein KQI81_24510 [Deltaproteobacteria bacterium]|nr:hypothetical protein [Deltaproteobacteria bacterium]